MGTTSPTGIAGLRRLAGDPRDGVTPFPGSPLDTSATVALHRQVYSRIGPLTLSGQVAEGPSLPSTRALAASLTVSRNTVRPRSNSSAGRDTWRAGTGPAPTSPRPFRTNC